MNFVRFRGGSPLEESEEIHKTVTALQLDDLRCSAMLPQGLIGHVRVLLRANNSIIPTALIH